MLEYRPGWSDAGRPPIRRRLSPDSPLLADFVCLQGQAFI